MIRERFIAKALAGALGTAAVVLTFSADIEIERVDETGLDISVTVPPAEARVGRPATPLSVAGVARRQTRRAIVRHNYYSALPKGCYWQAPYHYCGGIYYQPTVQDGKDVYIIVNP